jgi:hypothetical protein
VRIRDPFVESNKIPIRSLTQSTCPFPRQAARFKTASPEMSEGCFMVAFQHMYPCRCVAAPMGGFEVALNPSPSYFRLKKVQSRFLQDFVEKSIVTENDVLI